MTPIPFEESNRIYAADQSEYGTLPSWRSDAGDRQGRVVFLWELTWMERLQVLWSGHIWHQTLTFNRPLQPQMLSTEKPEMDGGADGTR